MHGRRAGSGAGRVSRLAGKLVLEDEAVVAFALEDMLTGLGCDVVGPAVRLMQALELAETEALDVAVLDVNINQGLHCLTRNVTGKADTAPPTAVNQAGSARSVCYHESRNRLGNVTIDLVCVQRRAQIPYRRLQAARAA